MFALARLRFNFNLIFFVLFELCITHLYFVRSVSCLFYVGLFSCCVPFTMLLRCDHLLRSFYVAFVSFCVHSVACSIRYVRPTYFVEN